MAGTSEPPVPPGADDGTSGRTPALDVVQLSGLLGMVLRSIEKVIAGTFMGVDTTALFDLGEKFPMMGTQIPGSITGVLLPASYRVSVRAVQPLLHDGAPHVRRRVRAPSLLFRGASPSSPPESGQGPAAARGGGHHRRARRRGGFDEGSVVLGPGDRLALCTDGVLEAVSPPGELFGTARLEDALGRGAGLSLGELRALVGREVSAWASGIPARDDVPLLLAEVLA